MLERIKSAGRRLLGRNASKLRFEHARWLHETQEEEFLWHCNDKKRQSPGKWMKRNARLFDHFGFSPSQWSGRTVIDLGAGSRLRTKYFAGATLVAIEPLADRYRAEIPWCDLDDASEVYAVPAEDLIEACRNRADFIISINVLDQCYDFSRVLENVRAYAKPEARIFLSFDKNARSDATHPLELDEEVCEEAFSRYGFRVVEATYGTDGVLARDAYRRGPYCLNYALERAPEPR